MLLLLLLLELEPFVMPQMVIAYWAGMVHILETVDAQRNQEAAAAWGEEAHTHMTSGRSEIREVGVKWAHSLHPRE